jgi:hypothetical protein
MPVTQYSELRAVIERHLDCAPIARPFANRDRELSEHDNRRIWLSAKIERLTKFLMFAKDSQANEKQALAILELRKLFRYSRVTKGRGSKSRENEFVTECLIAARLIPKYDRQGYPQLESDAWKTVLNDPISVPATYFKEKADKIAGWGDEHRSKTLNRIATRAERVARGKRRDGFPASSLDSIEKDALERIEKAERSARRTGKPYKSPFTD